MKNLIDGYQQFLASADRSRYAELCGGQKPHTLVIGCSDSRVIPEDIFSAGPGELFVLRNVGNLCCTDNPSVASAIEYGVGHLGVSRAVILAHGDCGAVKAACHLEHLQEKGIRSWLEEECYNGGSLEEAIKSWGLRQLKRLEDFPVVKEAVEKGVLETSLLYFDLGTLRLDRYDGESWTAVLQEKIPVME
ncbi:MAG: carbonic anhydrase [Thermovirgaceae bacterium]|nr:carbonic anhydrase [Thermovirgaceae bacterium]